MTEETKLNLSGKDNFARSMEIIQDNLASNELYIKMGNSNAEWKSRFDDFLKGKKTLPILYDPFFKNLFNPDIHKGRLSELISVILGQKVKVIRILPSECPAILQTL